MAQSPKSAGQLSAEKRALLAIEKLQAKVRKLESERAEPLAVVGMSCRYPGGANSPDAYWKLLTRGIDTVREVPENRWTSRRNSD